MHIPMALIIEMMFMTLCFFLAKRYLQAMNNGTFISFFQQFVKVRNVVEGGVKAEKYFRDYP